MTRAEWEAIAVALDHLWPGDFVDEDSAIYWLAMEEFPARPIERAVAQLASSAKWRPSPAQLVGASGLGDQVKRRRAWQTNFSSFEKTRGRALAIEFFDPRGEKESLYPLELSIPDDRLRIGSGI